MKQLLIILLLATPASADTAPTTLKASSYYCSYLNIRFPWGTCRARYCGRIKSPPRMVGIACGTRVDCRRGSGNRYWCRY